MGYNCMGNVHYHIFPDYKMHDILSMQVMGVGERNSHCRHLDWSWATPSFLCNKCGEWFHWGQSSRSLKLTTHLYLMLTLRMTEAVHLLPPTGLHVVHRANFSFTAYYYYYYWYSALGPVWAETRVQSGDWYGSGMLHPGQVLRGSLPSLSPAF